MRPAVAAALCCLATGVQAAEASPDDATLEASGARIGNIAIRTLPIFDPEVPSERNALFRLADRLHIDTRPAAIEAQLLFRTGDPFSRRLLDETERNLRRLLFLREPDIRVVGWHDGVVDLEVVAREVWTTSLGLKFHRAGGVNAYGASVEEHNLLGTGKLLAFRFDDDVDRTSYFVEWQDPNVFGSRWRDTFQLRDSDDGNGKWMRIERPFYALDTRWSAVFDLRRDDSIERVYRLGERESRYDQELETAELSYGWSRGLQNGWTRRWSAGFRHEQAEFKVVPDEVAPLRLPEDRQLDYPFLRLEAVQDDFDTALNLNQISRTEDLHYGVRLAIEAGWASDAFGADRDAALLRAEASRGYRFGGRKLLFTSASLGSRVESGKARDVLLSAALRYYHPTGDNSTFFTSLWGNIGHRLDDDHLLPLGGDEGLRGYPLRYQTGDSRALFTVEERFYTPWSLWHIADIGAAVFFDAGQSWGESLITEPGARRGLLKDFGFGLRLSNRRSAHGYVTHLDVAFPLDGDSSIEDVQFLVTTRESF